MKQSIGSPPSSPNTAVTEGQAAFPIVAIGASAGGLQAAKTFIGALPIDTGMAFILVQHLDPTHVSMMVDLLAQHSPIPVSEASNGVIVEPNHIYVIPPGHYLAFEGGALHTSQPETGMSIRLPFDYLLQSLARTRGASTFGIVLSGTGTDGSLGLKKLKEMGGRILAQDPEEADYREMPQNAIKTGAVDVISVAAGMPAILQKLRRETTSKAEDPSSGLIPTLGALVSPPR